MPDYNDGTPSLGEISRSIKDFRDEYRTGFSELVRKDVYAVREAAQDQRIAELEGQAKSKQALLYGTIAAAALSLLGWILSAVSGSA
jgi:hypothetical protein